MIRRIAHGGLIALAVAACADRPTPTEPTAARGPSAALTNASGEHSTHTAVNLRAGAVFAMTNDPSGNTINAYDRAHDGSLTLVGTFPTGGFGAGGGTDPLRSQGSLRLAGDHDDRSRSGDHPLLFAVNAGSNEISVLEVEREGLTVVSKVTSGGIRPTSLTVHKDLLYVLNALSGNISGFRIGKHGALTPIFGSSRPITGGNTADPSQVEFSPDGKLLVVTGKTLSNLDTYVVGKDGLTTGPHPNHSNGPSPFGFGFADHHHFAVSEPGGTASSYELSRDGSVTVVSGSVPDFQAAPCWLVITDNGRFAYLANAGSRSISSYDVGPHGTLRLLESVAGSTSPGGTPLDMALTKGSRFLYVLNDVNGMVDGFRVGAKGELTHVTVVGGLPPFAQGIAAW